MATATGAVVAIGDLLVGLHRLVGTRATKPGGLKEGKDEVSQSTSIHDMAKVTLAVAARGHTNRRPHGRLLLQTTVLGSLELPAIGLTALGTPPQILR